MKTKNKIISEFIEGTKDRPGLICLVSRRFPVERQGDVRLMCYLIKSALEDEDMNFISSGTLYNISELIDFDYRTLKSCYIETIRKIRLNKEKQDASLK